MILLYFFLFVNYNGSIYIENGCIYSCKIYKKNTLPLKITWDKI